MADMLDIAKLAVADLQRELPDSLDAAGTLTERKATILAPLVWPQLIERAPWPAAMRRFNLNADGAASPAYGYTYQYRLPAEIVRVWRVDGSSYHWQREGAFILSNDAGPLSVRAIIKIEPSEAPPLMIEAAAALLAVKLSRGLTESENDRRRAENYAEMAFQRAWAACGNQRGVIDMPQAGVLTEAGYTGPSEQFTKTQKARGL